MSKNFLDIPMSRCILDKSIYSDEELKLLFENLFYEKKKVKELEQKLQIIHQDHEVLLAEFRQIKSASVTQRHVESEEIEKLKCLITTYKKKSAQAIHALYENEHQKIKQETTLALQLRQLQAQIQDLTEENSSLLEQQKTLRLRYDQIETELKNKRVIKDEVSVQKNHELSNLYQEALINNRGQKEQIDTLTKALQEQEIKIQDLLKFDPSHHKDSELMTILEGELSQEKKAHQKLKIEFLEKNKALVDLQNHTDQLERVLKHVRERSQEAQLELTQLRGEFLKAQETLSLLQEKDKISQNRLHELTSEYSKIQSEKQELQEEMKALESQFPLLTTKVLEVQETLKNESKAKKAAEDQLESKVQFMHWLDHEVFSIKQILAKTFHEVKDIESRYLTLVNEKAALYNRSTQLEQILERNNQDIKILQKQAEETAKREEENLKKHQQVIDDFQKRIKELEDALQKHHRELHEKELEVEENNGQILGLSQEKLRLEETLSNVTRYQEEQDARIKVAQQHLGKKVKEVTMLSEKIEEQKEQLADLQTSLEQTKAKMSEMQNSFDQQQQQEKKHQEQLHETIRFSESQIVKWEEKYLKTYEKLKAMEEKQQQMQNLLSNLGNVMGSYSMPQTPPQIAKTSPSISSSGTKNTFHLVDTQNIQQQSTEHLQKEDSLFNPSQPSLFDLEQPRNQMRQNLFD